MPEILHLHQSKKYSDKNVLLLLIPIIIFGLILATYIVSKGIADKQDQTSYTFTSESSVLGKTDSLDKTKFDYVK